MDVSRNDSNLESNERSRRRFHLFHRACAISRKELRVPLETSRDVTPSSGDIGLLLHAFTREEGGDERWGEGRSKLKENRILFVPAERAITSLPIHPPFDSFLRPDRNKR